jgi:uncharacterized protein (DUF1501 family)
MLHPSALASCTRRQFLHVGLQLPALGLSSALLADSPGPIAGGRAKHVIQLFLVGGPSHLETFDPKPDAPDTIRGPFGTIPTRIPGVRFSEHLPRLAARADRFALIRTIHHGDAPVHETGHQLLQTGALAKEGVEQPHFAAVLSRMQRRTSATPPWVILPQPIGNTGVCVGHGQSAGWLGTRFEAKTADALPLHLPHESSATHARYGSHAFGQHCLRARQLVESGVRVVTVNMFETVFNRITWDCHANGSDLDSTLEDYRDVLCPMLDQAVSALLDDLADRGLLEQTLVLCMGEFGRTPKINNRGGRDHWPSCWSGLLAGGPIQPGRVIGVSDPHGVEPADRPVHASEIAATVSHALGIDVNARLRGVDGERRPIAAAKPIGELF